MWYGKLFVFALFISMFGGACATTTSLSSKNSQTSLAHPRPALFWENGQATVQILHVFDRTETDPVTGEVKTGIVTILGSGAVFDTNGLIITNSHVVDATAFEPEDTVHKIDALLVCQVVNGKRDCERATIAWMDKDQDVAMVETKQTFKQAVTLGPDSELLPGDEIYSWGNVVIAPTSPLFGRYVNRLEAPYANDFEVTTAGNAKRIIKLPFLLIDVRVGHGSSGGPVFDMLGRCMGLTSMMYADSQSGPTFGVIIPSSEIKKLIQKNQPTRP